MMSSNTVQLVFSVTFFVGIAMLAWASFFRRVQGAPGVGGGGRRLPWQHREGFTPHGSRIRIIGDAVWVIGALGMASLSFTGCAVEGSDNERLRAELLQLHRDGIQAHLDGDVSFFGKNVADDYTTVGRGTIRHPSREDIRAQFDRYLGSTEFSRYEDLQDPIIGVSDDGSVGWTIARVQVEGTRTLDDGSTEPLSFICSWMMLFRRVDDRWVGIGTASTFE